MTALKIAIGDYGLTKSLKQDGPPSGRLELEHIEISPITAAMRRMVRAHEFDICEMAITTYLCAREHGKPITAIPVFLTRNFHHWALFHKAGSGIRTPKDLEGRKVGVNRGYTVTTGLWVRGILQTEYGVDLKTITWKATDDEHVAEFEAPPNVDYDLQGRPIAELLLSGEIDAAIGDVRSDSPDIQPVIPDAREAGFAYYRKTGIYPINHTVVVSNAVLEKSPWVAEELFHAFRASKDAYLARLEQGGERTAADELALANGEVVGDPFPYGVAPNRKALETVTQFAVDQRVISKKPAPEELFAAGTLDLN